MAIDMIPIDPSGPAPFADAPPIDSIDGVWAPTRKPARQGSDEAVGEPLLAYGGPPGGGGYGGPPGGGGYGGPPGGGQPPGGGGYGGPPGGGGYGGPPGGGQTAWRWRIRRTPWRRTTARWRRIRRASRRRTTSRWRRVPAGLPAADNLPVVVDTAGLPAVAATVVPPAAGNRLVAAATVGLPVVAVTVAPPVDSLPGGYGRTSSRRGRQLATAHLPPGGAAAWLWSSDGRASWLWTTHGRSPCTWSLRRRTDDGSDAAVGPARGPRDAIRSCCFSCSSRARARRQHHR